MLPASSANRVWSQGSSASASPVQEPRPQPRVARSPLLFRAQERPNAGQRNRPADAVRIDGEAVKDRRGRERDRRPSKPCGGMLPRRQPRQVPRERAAARGDEQQEQDDAPISADCKGRRDECGQAGRVDRVDLAVAPRAEVVRRQRPPAVRLIVAAQVVVLDLEIAIEQQALRDDEVMRLVASGHRRRHLPRRAGKDDEGERAGRETRSVAQDRNRAIQKVFETQTRPPTSTVASNDERDSRTRTASESIPPRSERRGQRATAATAGRSAPGATTARAKRPPCRGRRQRLPPARAITTAAARSAAARCGGRRRCDGKRALREPGGDGRSQHGRGQSQDASCRMLDNYTNKPRAPAAEWMTDRLPNRRLSARCTFAAARDSARRGRLAAAILMTWPLASGTWPPRSHAELRRRALRGLERRLGGARALDGPRGALRRQHLLSPSTHARLLGGEHRRRHACASSLARDAQPFAAHNSVVLFAFAASIVCDVAACAAAHRRRRRRGDIGVLFAFCPYVFSHTAHIQLLMVAGIPLCLLDAPSAGRRAVAGARRRARPGARRAGDVVRVLRHLRRPDGRYGDALLRVVAPAVDVAPVLDRDRDRRRLLGRNACCRSSCLTSTSSGDAGFARSLDDARQWSAYLRSYLASGAHAHAWLLADHPRLERRRALSGLRRDRAWVSPCVSARRCGSAPPRPNGTGCRATARRRSSTVRSASWRSGRRSVRARGLYIRSSTTSIPVFSFLRAPERMGIVVMLCLAVLRGVRRPRSCGAPPRASSTRCRRSSPARWRSSS